MYGYVYVYTYIYIYIYTCNMKIMYVSSLLIHLTNVLPPALAE